MKQREDYRQVPNFNLIPLEYQKPTISLQRFSLRVLLVLVIVAEVFFITNLYLEKSVLDTAIDSTRQKIGSIGAKVDLVKAREALEQERRALEADWGELTMKQADWPQVLVALFQSKPRGVRLSSVKQDGSRLNVTGTASDYKTLVEYHHVLLASPAISQIVSLTSMQEGSAISFSLVIEVKGGGTNG